MNLSELSNFQFILAAIAACAGIILLLQVLVIKVLDYLWLGAFLGATVTLFWTLR